MCGKAVSEVLWTLVKSWDLLQGENCSGFGFAELRSGLGGVRTQSRQGEVVLGAGPQWQVGEKRLGSAVLKGLIGH